MKKATNTELVAWFMAINLMIFAWSVAVYPTAAKILVTVILAWMVRAATVSDRRAARAARRGVR